MQTGIVTRITPDIRRILAPNPSALTGPGTNTYLIGSGPAIVVVDPGPSDDTHLHAIIQALGSDSVSAIVVTHAHRDHSAGAATLAAQTGASVLAFGTAQSGRSALMQQLVADGLEGGGEGLDHGFAPDQTLEDGDTLPCATDSLRVIHTPGHMGGHICLALGDVLLSGDHAMGWASSLVSPPDGDMGAYLSSMQRLRAESWRLMLPGHGEAVTEVGARLRFLTEHRLQREGQILNALRAAPANCKGLTRQIYHDTPPGLLPAAERNVLAHLIDLWDRKRITCPGFPTFQTIFTRSAGM